MRVTKHDRRAAVANRPIVDFTEPAMRAQRGRSRHRPALVGALIGLLKSLGH